MKRDSSDFERPFASNSTDTAETKVSQREMPPAQAAVAEKPVRKFSLKTFNSLRYRDYRLLWFSNLFTSAGMWMEQIAFSWLVYDMTGSAFMLGAINGLRALPFLFFGPIAGVVADRVNRKTLMLGSQIYVFVVTTFVTALIFGNSAGVFKMEVWHLFFISFFSSIGWSFTQPVRQALVPNLVPREEMVNAVALQSAGFNSTRVLGPAAAGIIIAWVGPGGAFAAKALAYIVIIALIAMMKVPPTPANARQHSMGHNLVEGFRYIGSNQIALSLIVLALIPMLLAMPFQTLMPVFARDILGMGPKGYGLLISFAGIGALTGTLIVASLGGFRRKGVLLLSSVTILGVFLILFSRSTWLPASLFFMIFIGGFQMTYMSLNNTLLHLNITDDMRGRVMSIYMLDSGLTPLGSLFAGGMASFFGAPFAVTFMGASCIVLAAIAMMRVPIVRRLS